jgi:hypothetical protein
MVGVDMRFQHPLDFDARSAPRQASSLTEHRPPIRLAGSKSSTGSIATRAGTSSQTSS